VISLKKKRPLRDIVSFLREQKIPVRAICRDFSVYRANLCRYLPSPVSQDPLSKRITELADEYLQYGYRRLRVLLHQEGTRVNHKKVCRLFNHLSLQKEVKSSRTICLRFSPNFPRGMWCLPIPSSAPKMAPDSERALSIAIFPLDRSNTSSSNRAGLIKWVQRVLQRKIERGMPSTVGYESVPFEGYSERYLVLGEQV